ncbi:MAG: PAS domain-containing protein [Bacteroidales bacterium]
MSELINNSTTRINRLYEFAHRFIDGENVNSLINDYQELNKSITAIETMQVLDLLLLKGYSLEKVKLNVGKLINVYYKSLNSNNWEKPGEGHFIYYMMQENNGARKIMTALKPLIREIHKRDLGVDSEPVLQLKLLLNKLKDFELHYIKKENILFPYIEKIFPQYRCLQIMWSFHDDSRKSMKSLENILQAGKLDKNLLNIELGKLFFATLPIIFRTEQILFPVAFSTISEEGWDEMLDQSFEAGWCFGVKPQRTQNQKKTETTHEGKINLDTGFLYPAQLILLFENLPVDITYVDENDEVCYFSGAKHRIFPRSKAIIGRKVQNCHPPESVHIVNEIVEAFRNGKKEKADFWIQMKGRFIHIRYFALRNENGEYKGTIEVSQDVTEIRALEGEQRLLDWY